MADSQTSEASQAHAASVVWRMAIERLGADASTPEGLSALLERVIARADVLQMTRWARQPAVMQVGERPLDACYGTGQRRDAGIYFTPPELAQAMVAWLDDYDGVIVDPACGDGALLVAAARSGHRVWGIERELPSAVACAIRLVESGADARVVCGDGLDTKNWPARCAVLANPPYVGEKGRKALFDEVRATHPDLAKALGPRADLAYFFWLRAMERADRLAFLVSEYWMWATSARGVRRAMRVGPPVTHLLRLGQGRFASAPGHHSMLVLQQHTRPVGWFEVTTPTPDALEGAIAFEVAEDGVRLGDQPEWSGQSLDTLCRDFQGFVSGLDRPADGRGFLVDRRLPGYHTRPVLRAAQCVANHVFLEPPGSTQAIWLDAAVDDRSQERLRTWFGQHRERLEGRREAALGRMPWYRLHWPRDRADMTGPKLVVPRRSVAPCFCLDLSASVVSSDCTYLVAPPDIADPVGYLASLMVALNSDDVLAQLRHSGKRKGHLFEFYAEPLRRLKVEPLALDVEVSLEARLRDAVAAGDAWIDLNRRLSG